MKKGVRESMYMRRMLALSLFAVFLCFSNVTKAQSNVLVTGRVADENNQPLSGVSIQVQKTKSGTTTDASGSFSVSAPSNATLLFTYVGFTDTTIAIEGRTSLDIRLSVARSTLSDVVVIGYGVASKRDLTGSIVKVDGKVVADKPNTNPIASLQGRVAGLSVVNSGTPGQAPDIRIRGTASIGNVHPLYVVDGIFNDNIDYINPNDIESIEILKDPSSLAIFGVRGATGVIAITTKKARAGQTIINFNSSYGFKDLVDKIKFVDADGFKLLYAEERANDAVVNGTGTPGPYDYTGLTANTDWIDAVTRTGQFNTNNLSVSSSTDKNRFTFGLGYQLDQGLIKHEELQKLLFSLSDEVKLSKGIKLGVILNASRQKNPYDATTVLDDARKVVPMVSAGTKPFLVRDAYGTDSITQNIYSALSTSLQTAGVVNPLLRVENEYNTRKSYEYRTVGSVYADITFLKAFNFRSTLYADISNVNTRQYTPLYYAYNPVNDVPYLYNTTTALREDDQTYRKFQQDHVLSYKQSFGPHNLTLTAGFTTYYFGNFNRTGRAAPGNKPIPNDPRFWYITSGFESSDPGGVTASSAQSEYTTASYLGRALYNFNNKYFLNASFRDDASSRIPSKNRHQQFWSVGAAWDVSKENFMLSQKIFNYLKIKGSIGVLGNQTASYLDGTPINYPFYPNLVTGNNAVFGYNGVFFSANTAYIPNPDLKWETIFAQEAGFELNAFDNRLHFEANYYNRTTRDLLTYISRPTTGLKDELINGGKLRNWGEEFTASWNQNLTKDLILNVSGNITFQKNKVISLSADLPNGFLSRSTQNNGSAESRTLPGAPIGSFYGYVVEGLYQSYNDISKSPPATGIGGGLGAGGTPIPGDFKFKDVNGDGKITADDRTIIGNPTPDFIYGGSISLTYKGFSLSADVVGSYGNEIFRVWGSLESPFQRVNYSAEKLERWNGPGTSNWVPRISQGDRYNYNGSTYNIEDGSYFRIRNLQLAYSFDQSLIGGLNLKALRVFANVQNLKTFKNNLGYTADYGGDATYFGYDYGGGAIPMITTFGLNVTF